MLAASQVVRSCKDCLLAELAQGVGEDSLLVFLQLWTTYIPAVAEERIRMNSALHWSSWCLKLCMKFEQNVAAVFG